MKKIEEYPISFKTAKLAKEKGFKQLCNFSYDEDGVLTGNCEQVYNYVAPTQSLLQTWLREKHQIIITINTDCTAEPKYVYEINVFKGNPRNLAEKEWGWYFHKQEDWGLYYTYEDALEGGLVEALTLIEKDLNFE